MGSFWNEEATSVAWPDRISSGPTTSFAENYYESYGANKSVELLSSESVNKGLAVRERRDLIEELTGKPYFEALGIAGEEGVNPFDFTTTTEAEEDAVEALRNRLGSTDASQIYTRDALDQRAKTIALNKWAENEDTAARARGFTGKLGQFLGAPAAQFTDPIVMATLPIGPAVGARLSVQAAINGALAGAVTAAQQPWVQAYRKELGLPHGMGVAAANVATAAAGGGLLTLGVGGLIKGVGKLADAGRVKPEPQDPAGFLMPPEGMSPRKQLEAFDALVRNPTAEQLVARHQLEADIEFHEVNPFQPKVKEASDKLRSGFQELEVERAAKKEAPVRKGQRPPSAVTFIRNNGGIRDVEGNLAAMEAPSDIRKVDTGKSPAEMLRLLIENKYIDETPFEGGVAKATTNDMYKIIERHLAGEKTYSQLDAARVEQMRADDLAAQEQDEIAAVASFLEAKVQEVDPGFELRPEEYRRAAELWTSGERDPEALVMRLGMEMENAAVSEHRARAAATTRALDNDEMPPRVKEDPELRPLVDNGDEFSYRADPQAPKFQEEMDSWRQNWRARIEEEGDFDVPINELDDGNIKASKILDDLDKDENFLRELEQCQ